MRIAIVWNTVILIMFLFGVKSCIDSEDKKYEASQEKWESEGHSGIGHKHYIIDGMDCIKILHGITCNYEDSK